MDRNSQKTELERLILVTQASRQRLTEEIGVFRQRLDVPARVRGSLRQHPGGWLGGSVVAGLLASLVFRRKKTTVEWRLDGGREKRRRAGLFGFIGSLLTLASPMLMSLAKAWIGNQVRHFLATQTLPPFLSRAYPAVSRFAKPR
jgi:hypothetical protein